MKVLFGMTNKDVIQRIVKSYEETYKEKIEHDEAYYFKDFEKKLGSGNYDRAVLTEELEKIVARSKPDVDKILYEWFARFADSIDDPTNIIVLMSERRTLGPQDEFLVKLYLLGIYSTLTGSNRTVRKVCERINKPVTRKEARAIYGGVNPNDYNSDKVPENQINHIKTYFENNKNNTDKFNDIFDSIVKQYNTNQMITIIYYLPDYVKQYLEANNATYKEILSSKNKISAPGQQTEQPQQQQPTTIIDNTKSNAGAIEIEKDDVGPRVVNKDAPVKPDKKEVPVRPDKKDDGDTKVVIKEKPVVEVKETEIIKHYFDVPKDYQKTVIFVGAPKAGTTFCINAIGTYLAKEQKIKTALVDMTRKRDLYTIYTYDNTGKRNIAAESLKYASNGKNEPLVYDKLSIYTAVPGEDRKSYNPNLLVETISKKNNVVLIDADFSTPLDYFRLASDIYIVQDMNVLNISQITMFLRELKSRNVDLQRIKIIINKYVKCDLSEKDIIDYIAAYTSYDLKIVDALFNPKKIQYFTLPFDVNNYIKYIEMVYKYSNKFSSFTKDFQANLDEIINTIYPTRGKVTVEEKRYTQQSESKSKGFGIFRKK